MAVVPAVITDDARLYLPQMWGGLLPFQEINYFKVGEGGWIDPGTGRERRVPVPNLRRFDSGIQDLDAVVDTTRAVIDQRYGSTERAFYGKALLSTDMSFIAPSQLEIRCLLTDGEFVDDGYGNSPEIWEIGVYSDHPVYSGQRLMIAYGTVTRQVKTATSLLNILRITV